LFGNWLCGNGKWLFGNWLLNKIITNFSRQSGIPLIFINITRSWTIYTQPLPISNFHRLWRDRAIGGAKLPISIASSVNKVVKLYKYLISNIIELHPIPKTTSFNLVYFFQLINPFLPKPTLLSRFFQRLIKKI